MDIKSLMLGDWVKIKTYGVSEKFERTEAYMYVKVVQIGSGYIIVEYNNDMEEPYRICDNTDIEPIPLTPEILEKNGWKWNEYHTMLNLVVGTIHVGWGFYKDCLNISDHSHDGDCQISSLKCIYVHQLQHALKLCGIEKEIKL